MANNVDDWFRSISVVIPTFNRAALVGEAIASVRRQPHADLEIIVVDDGSTDETPEMLRARNDVDVVVRQSNAGPAAARNAGIRRARGEWIGFLDADDLWTSDALLLHGKAIESSRPSMIVGSARFESLDGSPVRSPISFEGPLPQSSFDFVFRFRHYHFGNALVRADICKAIGPLDESMYFHEDIEWFSRAESLGIAMLVHDGIVQVRRFHETNMTKDTETMRKTFPRLVQRILMQQRRRTGGR